MSNTPTATDRKPDKPLVSVETEWKLFELVVVPQGACEHQRKAMRLAFYGGFQSALTALTVVANQPNIDIAVDGMNNLLEQCSEFGASI